MNKIILLGNPLSTQNLYKISCRVGFAQMYMSKEGTTRKEQYQWEAKSQWKGEPVFYPIDLQVKLYFGDKRKRDIDNFTKICYDSLTGIVWGDDHQVVKVMIEMLYDKKNPRIELIIDKLKTPN